MIIGLGTDIVECSRIAGMLDRHGDIFLERIFTSAEITAAENKKAAKTEFISGRWAAKEAAAKALGCGFGEHCAWLDIEVISDEKTGKPMMRFSGAAFKTALSLGVRKIHVSISHESSFASATVILED